METIQVSPIFYLEHLVDDEIQRHSCSDRIWLPQKLFNRFAYLMEIPGELFVLSLTNGLGQSVVGVPYQPHHNTEIDEILTIYIPPWMYEILSDDPYNIRVERIVPGLLTSMSILPYTSQHLYEADTETALRDAFENYGCIQMGQKIPLLLSNNNQVEVEIYNTEPKQYVPLCIRSSTIELDLMTPLDQPYSPPKNEPSTLPSTLPTTPSVVVPIQPTVVNTNSIQQPDRETLRQQMLAATLRRLNNNVS